MTTDTQEQREFHLPMFEKVDGWYVRIGVNLRIEADSRSQEELQTSAAAHSIKPTRRPDPDRMTVTLFVNSGHEAEAADAAAKAVKYDERYQKREVFTYLALGIIVGDANKIGEQGHILDIHEGSNLTNRYPRRVLTAFTGRMVKRLVDHGMTRPGSAIITRTGVKDTSPAPPELQERILRVNSQVWQEAQELAGEISTTDTEVVQALLDLARGHG